MADDQLYATQKAFHAIKAQTWATLAVSAATLEAVQAAVDQ